MHKHRKRRVVLVAIVVTLFCASYAQHRYGNKPLMTGHMQDKRLNETSGIAASAINPDIYYVHNDSGDTSRFFAITPNGTLKRTFYFKGDPRASLGVTDCEDIAVGPGPDTGKSYIYLGDIGDNHSTRPYITVYRIPEPSITQPDSIVKAVPLHLNYPDGAKDAETLMVDPLEKLLYIVSKRHNRVGVYTTPLTFKANDTLTLTKRCQLHFSGLPLFKWITAGDISKDGRQILLKSYVRVYYWRRNGSEPIWQTMQRNPTRLPYEEEKQGEAIGFTNDGKAYYTTSEGVYAPIYLYQLPAIR